MSDTLSKIEKRTAYILILPAVFLVFSIILFPIFANVWISFKEVGLKDIRIPEPRAKKIVKSISENESELKVIYKLRNSSLIQEIRNVQFQDKFPKNVQPFNLDSRCTFKSKKIICNFGNWEPKYKENFEIIVKNIKGEKILKLYQYYTKVAKHYFCSICGIHTHNRPRINPKIYGINIACIDDIDTFALKDVPVNNGENHPLDQKK